MSEQKFIWTDLETSGLSVDDNKILEIAVVATDNKLNVLGEYKVVLKCDDFSDMNDFVLDMHTKNGLIEDCKKAYMNLAYVEKELIKWCEDLKLGDKPIMAGNSVHFDKSFVRKWMPKFDAILHYRILDVSTLKEMLRNFYGLKIEIIEYLLCCIYY